MGFFQELAGRIDEATMAGGRFAESLVRVAGGAVSGMLVFLDRELMYAQKGVKKAAGGRGPQTKEGVRKRE